jgi:UDP-galactopyranose mutase
MANKINAINGPVNAATTAQQTKTGLSTRVISFETPRNYQGATSIDNIRSHKAVETSSVTEGMDFDLVCLSHLRWDFVYQRPQHLLGRCAKQRRVFFVEEPIFGDGPLHLDVSMREEGVYVVVPHIPEGMLREITVDAVQEGLIDRFFAERQIKDFVLWYYTPMAVGFTRHLKPKAVIFDCMDELSAFKNAPATLKEREAELFRRADLVFTGGQSLYEAKRDHHHSVHAFPSSIDADHFMKARVLSSEPADQQSIPHPRIGFFGVIDERLDIDLLDKVAQLKPDWQLVVIGPVVKIDPNDLPRHDNIHYLGGKSYKELPAYLSGWDVAMLPFARNDSTRFISPTKTPEYLAAGCPVVSTSIRDVVRPYGQKGLVHIADTAEEFVAAIEAALNSNSSQRLMTVDAFLKQMSWDRTWSQMNELIEDVIAGRSESDEGDPEAGQQRALVAAAR